MSTCFRCGGTHQVLTPEAKRWLSMSGTEQAKVPAPDPHQRFVPCPACTPTPKGSQMKIIYMKDPTKFLVDSGLLFEINRRVLHPYGLALALECPDTDAEREMAAKSENGGFRLWDDRTDPEGICFADEDVAESEAKLATTAAEARPRFETRRAALGYVVQGMSPDQTAQRAYKAYGDSTGWVNFLGKPMPKWEDLPPAIQKAWRDATAAVVEP